MFSKKLIFTLFIISLFFFISCGAIMSLYKLDDPKSSDLGMGAIKIYYEKGSGVPVEILLKDAVSDSSSGISSWKDVKKERAGFIGRLFGMGDDENAVYFYYPNLKPGKYKWVKIFLIDDKTKNRKGFYLKEHEVNETIFEVEAGKIGFGGAFNFEPEKKIEKKASLLGVLKTSVTKADPTLTKVDSNPNSALKALIDKFTDSKWVDIAKAQMN